MTRVAVGVGVLAVLLGVLGIVRGAISDSPPAAATSVNGPIVATGATVRMTSSSSATASMTVYNTTNGADVITGAESGAGAAAQLSRASVAVPKQGNVAVTVTIGKLYGPLAVGQYVNIQLDLQVNGSVLVTARVVGSTGTSRSISPSAPSGVHS